MLSEAFKPRQRGAPFAGGGVPQSEQMMDYPDDETIERLATLVVGKSLPAPEWTHAAHFAVALWLLRFRPDLTTPEGMRATISEYNQSTGKLNTDSSGYHHTITRASIGAAKAQLRLHSPDTPLHRVLTSLMASELGSPDWPLLYWRRESLFSVEARRSWIAPDFARLPFVVEP